MNSSALNRAVLIGLMLMATAAAQSPTTRADAPVTRPSDLLGEKYSSAAYGLEFRVPLNFTAVPRPNADTIVEFDRPEFNWRLQAWRRVLESPLELSIYKDQLGQPQNGVLEVTLDNIKQGAPNVEVIRDEVINVGAVRVGMLAVRYDTATGERRLTQQAIFQAPDADNRLYYFLDLTGPGKPAAEPKDLVNPAEKLAADTFAQVVDSVVLLDRAGVAQNQRQRLYSTHALFVNWAAGHYQPVRAALQPEQWQRILRDGKDVGYSYIVEELDSRGAPENATVRIGVRSRLMPTPLLQWDTQTWMNASSDRAHESWSTIVRCSNHAGELLDGFSQVGTSDERTKAVALHPQGGAGGLGTGGGGIDGGPLGQGNVDIAVVRSLQITTMRGRNKLSPLSQDTPVFYVPAAFSFLLPHLLPLNRPHQYMFATFVGPDANLFSPPALGAAAGGQSGLGDIMSRYMDVAPVQQVTFNGQEVTAVVITDRLGLEGLPTTYYMAPDGKFIGSIRAQSDGSKTSTIMVLPTDSDTLLRLWPRPDLTRPPEPPQQ
jgi:hypothetical protein